MERIKNMVKFFLMVFDGFIWLFNFLNRFSLVINSGVKWLVFKTSIKFFLFTVFSAFVMLMVTLSIAFFYYLIKTLISLFNLVSFLIDYINVIQTHADSAVSLFAFFLNVFGISAGFEMAFPYIASAVLFFLLKTLYVITLKLYFRVWTVLKDSAMMVLS